MNQYKQKVIAAFLEQGMTQIILDARKQGVYVPVKFKDDPKLILNLSWRFKHKMELREDRILAELTFSGQPFACVIPWEAIWHTRQGDHSFLFGDSFPSDQLDVITDEAEKEENESRFKAIEGGSELSTPRQGHLRLLH